MYNGDPSSAHIYIDERKKQVRQDRVEKDGDAEEEGSSVPLTELAVVRPLRTEGAALGAPQHLSARMCVLQVRALYKPHQFF